MNPCNRGFSTLEAVMALLLISLAALVIFPVVRSAGRSMKAIQSKGVDSVRILELKRTLDKEMYRLRPGWWIHNPDGHIDQHRARLSGWNGSIESNWNMEIVDGAVHFGTGESMRVYSIPENSSLEMESVDPDDFRKGIIFTLVCESGTTRFRIIPGGQGLWND